MRNFAGFRFAQVLFHAWNTADPQSIRLDNYFIGQKIVASR